MKTFNTALKLTAIAAVALTLVACGGGGGGGSVSAPAPAIEKTEAQKAEEARVAEAARVEAARVEAVMNVSALNTRFGASNITLGNKDINVDAVTGVETAKYTKPDWAHADVLEAYNAGWTGKGIGVQIIDDFTVPASGTSHGKKVQSTAQNIAQGAYVYGLNHQSGAYVETTTGNARTQYYKVVNLSFGSPTDVTNEVQLAALTVTKASQAFFSGGPTPNSLSAANVLITKAAGNGAQYTVNGANIDRDTLNRAFKGSSNVIFVGNANTANAVVANPSLVNTNRYTGPGLDAIYQSKFLVAKAPWADANGSLSATQCVAPVTCGTGSSYAAPVVAGYGAIIMQKFNGISGAQTAQVLLTTAKKDFSEYRVDIHGQGEASLSRALSPVGPMR